MKLHTLGLINFKGARSLTLNFDGRDARILGDNATFKSTVRDAYIWLLTGKDSQGRSDYNIKTLDADNNAIPMLDHAVRAVIEYDGAEFELTRTYKEVWQKKSGTNVKTFNGHKTEFQINGVPKSEKEYSAFIETIAPMQIICLLTMTSYFNEQIKADVRRRMLLEIGGDVDESELLALPQFAELKTSTGPMVTVADLKKSKTAQKAKINDELKGIPPAINAHTQYLNDGKIDADAERASIAVLQAQIASLDAEISGLDNGETLSHLRKELAELETEQMYAQAAAKKKTLEATDFLRAHLQTTREVRQAAQNKRAQVNGEHFEALTRLSNAQALKTALLDKYNEAEESMFAGEDTCPTCNQPLPPDTVDAAIAQFNENKANQLEQIVIEGRKAAANITYYDALASRLTDEIAALDAKIAGFDAEIAENTESIRSVPEVAADFDPSRIEAKRAEIAACMQSSFDTHIAHAERMEALTAEKSAHERNIAAIDNSKQAAAEIAKLKAREKELAAAFEACEKIISLCDDFTNERVKRLDEKISGAFRVARFKLTETLVNGGLREICETLIDGVPYGSANKAAKINVGLDIIDTFSKHYGVQMPIFVDDAEGVTELAQIDTQCIQLVVSKAHKKLTMEVI